MALTEFEKLIHKFISNAVFGKSLQDNRKFLRVSFFFDPEHAVRRMGHPMVKHFKLVNDDLVIIYSQPTVIEMNRPYAIGFAILELSKEFVFSQYYDIIQPALGPTCRVLMSDTDSFVLAFNELSRTDALQRLSGIMDFSNYPTNHVLHDSTHRAQLGRWKDEMRGTHAILEFVGIRSKSYAMRTRTEQHGEGADAVHNVHNRSKGILRARGRAIPFEHYVNCLTPDGCVDVTFHQIMSVNHHIYTVKVTKRAFDAFDDKRFLLKCGRHTKPHRIPEGWAEDHCVICSPTTTTTTATMTTRVESN